MMRWSPSAPARPGCPHRRLARLLAIELGSGVTIGASTLRPWASANFIGARHLFPCTGDRPTKALQDRLTTAEWRLPGHIVADVAVDPGEGTAFTIEILTVED
ncbi:MULTISPECIES: hypothetical protein [unclassified Sphingopyxis]|jgi:hypothetical protein|uniref:hypothetical protein n=1 Tax=Sphingopyxis sp. DBS4 TaxID=2968500 RepID=UPI00214C8DA2|nr:hypothetical protein [Sphingopyxis sp. DBS4]